MSRPRCRRCDSEDALCSPAEVAEMLLTYVAEDRRVGPPSGSMFAFWLLRVCSFCQDALVCQLAAALLWRRA